MQEDSKTDERYLGKYRIASARHEKWDYADDGCYFVTWCVKDRIRCLCDIVDGNTVLSPAGQIVVAEWERTALLRTNVTLDAMVVMPDHVHGILAIQHTTTRVQAKKSRLTSNSLGAIMGQMKMQSTKRIRVHLRSTFAWQTRFWDRIIRNARELDAFRDYIARNPAEWGLQSNAPDGLWM
jgi:putative transposase